MRGSPQSVGSRDRRQHGSLRIRGSIFAGPIARSHQLQDAALIAFERNELGRTSKPAVPRTSTRALTTPRIDKARCPAWNTHEKRTPVARSRDATGSAGSGRRLWGYCAGWFYNNFRPHQTLDNATPGDWYHRPHEFDGRPATWAAMQARRARS